MCLDKKMFKLLIKMYLYYVKIVVFHNNRLKKNIIADDIRIIYELK